MGPDILALLIPIIAILGGCSIAVTKIVVGAKKNSLSDGQVKMLMEKMQTMDTDNQSLKQEIENLRLIASGDYIPDDTELLIEQKVEEAVNKKLLLSKKNQ